MRLLNALTQELELFPDPVSNDVPYAILSHTWMDDEVTFEDMKDVPVAQTKVGFAKIRAACDKAAEFGLHYIWVDTCCIDKSSSAELSEAINSMYRWYKNSTICFAFLADLPSKGSPVQSVPSSMRGCRWFTRGWTLQELIAPHNFMFVDEDWKDVGTKVDLSGEIEAITGISRWVLDGSQSLASIPLAKRMSWAAARQTTRVEDKAYCLLGIFGVNMPMIYGEGCAAFIRLQQAILSMTTDLSLFAWEAFDSQSDSCRGILAESPAEFLNCGSI
ncbi:HET-domain-containing protein, partial [Thozetella sp. PMI_491]